MQRTAVNPWDWSLKHGYNQAEIVEDISRQLICAGQTAVDNEGNPQHPGDMRSQIKLALDNLEAVLAMRFGPIQCAPPMTLLGVSRLAMPSLLFEIEATAAA